MSSIGNVSDNRYLYDVTLQSLDPVPVETGAMYDPRTYGVMFSVRL